VDRDSLRSVQQPLKERYRIEPEAALVTLRAEGALGEGVTCSVHTGRAHVEAGLHPASGGSGLSLTERYCVVYQTLLTAPLIEVALSTSRPDRR
jgi:hypothetical protein